MFAVAALLSACGGGGDNHAHDHGGGTGFAAGDADTKIAVTLGDFRFDGLPGEVTGPKVFLDVRNDGPNSHELVVEAADGEPVGGVGPFPKGKQKTLAVELPAGTYTIVCNVEEKGTTHATLGMKATLTVT